MHYKLQWNSFNLIGICISIAWYLQKYLLPVHTYLFKQEKRNVDFKCHTFKTQWNVGYFPLMAKCFIMHFYHIALLKKCNICGQYQIKYGTWYSQFTGKQWTEKLENLEWNISSWQNFLKIKKWNHGFLLWNMAQK